MNSKSHMRPGMVSTLGSRVDDQRTMDSSLDTHTHMDGKGHMWPSGMSPTHGPRVDN